jgi:phage I-like protein
MSDEREGILLPRLRDQDAETTGDYATVSGTKVHRSDFAYAPAGSKPSEWKLAIHDAAHVRNALARFNQTDMPAAAKAAVYAKIKAAARKFGIEVSEESSDVGAIHESPLLSEVRNGLVKIAAAYTGEFERDGRKFSITPKDLEEMAANLGAREVPIDYEHQSALGAAPPGWAKAAGWIRRPDGILDFRLPILDSENRKSKIQNRKLLWAWAELTPACLAMIKQKEYRYFSPEIHWHDLDERGKRIGTRLAAGAMTNRPFLKNLPPIEVSDEDYNGLFGLSLDVGPRLRGDDSGSGRGDARHSRAGGNPPRLAMVALSDGGKLMDLDSVHVPRASRQISIAYHQTGEAADEIENRKSKIENGEKTMSNKFSFRKLTEGPHQGKYGLYKSDELMMDEGEPMVFDDEDFPRADAGDGEDTARDGGDAGRDGGETLPASGQAPLAATEARRLAEMFREGRVDLGRASALAAEGRLALGAVFRAQAAEKLVDQFIAEGKLLPKRRAAAFRLALEDEAGLRALLSDARPMVDFRSWGLAGAAHLAGSAQTELDEMVRQWIAEHDTDYSAALSEVTKRNPELWQRASAEVSDRAPAGEDEQD